MTVQPIATGRRQDTALAVAALVLGLCGLFLVSQGGSRMPARFAVLLVVLVQDGLLAVGWLVAAVGWGWMIRRALLGRQLSPLITQAALGIAALLLLDWLLGWAGWLNGWTIWAVTGAGWLMVMWQGLLLRV